MRRSAGISAEFNRLLDCRTCMLRKFAKLTGIDKSAAIIGHALLPIGAALKEHIEVFMQDDPAIFYSSLEFRHYHAFKPFIALGGAAVSHIDRQNKPAIVAQPVCDPGKHIAALRGREKRQDAVRDNQIEPAGRRIIIKVVAIDADVEIPGLGIFQTQPQRRLAAIYNGEPAPVQQRPSACQEQPHGHSGKDTAIGGAWNQYLKVSAVRRAERLGKTDDPGDNRGVVQIAAADKPGGPPRRPVNVIVRASAAAIQCQRIGAICERRQIFVEIRRLFHNLPLGASREAGLAIGIYQISFRSGSSQTAF